MKEKVVIIGLDGATLTLMEPWIEQGKLPNLARIVREGSSGPLESTPEKMSPAAWTSFSTGVNPGRHGIFHFFSMDPSTLKIKINNATNRKVEPFWNLVGKAGKRVCIINVPTTYPADKVNGCMVSGWDAPSVNSKGFTWPPELIDEVIERFHDYPLVPTLKKFSITQMDLAINDLHRVLDIRIALSKYLLEKERWDLFITVLTETDQSQHFFWHLTDKTHPLYNEDLFKKHGDVILGIYEKCDRLIGDIMEKMGDDGTIVIVSDHGAGIHCQSNKYLRVLLERTGFLKQTSNMNETWIGIRRRFLDELSRLIGYDMKKKIQKILGKKDDIGLNAIIGGFNWANTRAYPSGTNLRINVKGREAFGIVQEGEEYNKVVNALIAMLRGCVDLETGRPIVRDIIRRDDAYHGAYMDYAPDLVVKWVEDFVISGVFCRLEDGREVRIPPSTLSAHDGEWTGDHADNGIFMAKGPHMKGGYKVHDAKIMDIAPSILYLMGIPASDDLDGKVLTDIFLDEFLKARRAQVAGVVDADNDSDKAYSDEEEEEIKKRLRDLGYL